MARTKERTVSKPKSTEKVYIRIDMETWVHVTREADPHAEYDGDDTDQETLINGFLVVEENQTWDFIMPGPVQPTYLLIRVVYSTGDSFSHHKGRVSLVTLLEADARDDAARIIEAISLNMEQQSYDVKLGPGRTFHVDASPWTGYFESIESVYCDVVTLMSDRMRF